MTLSAADKEDSESVVKTVTSEGIENRILMCEVLEQGDEIEERCYRAQVAVEVANSDVLF
jgi:hypothetical protein